MCCGFWQFLALEFNNTYNKGREEARKTSWEAGSLHVLCSRHLLNVGNRVQLVQ